jgi:hypothetical protein
LALALARSLEQTKHRFGHIGVTDKDTLHRPHVVGTGCAGQREIGRVRINNVAARIRHCQTIESMIGNRPRHRVFRKPVGETNDTRGEGEQCEKPDHGQQGQQRQNIRLRLAAPEGHEGNRRRDDRTRHQKHKQDTPAPPRRLMDGGEG